MNGQMIAITALAILVLVFLMLRGFRRGKKPSRYAYQRRGLLFNPDERAFYWMLQQAIGEDYEVFGKIHAADLILPKKNSAYTGKKAFNPVEDRVFDFILCEKKSLNVACAIQLNASSQIVQREQDPLLPICETVGLPLVRFIVQADYSIEIIRERLHQALVKAPLPLGETGGRKEPHISNIDGINF